MASNPFAEPTTDVHKIDNHAVHDVSAPSKAFSFRAEVTSGFPPIGVGALTELLGHLKSCRSNEERIERLQEGKKSFMFTTAQLKEILETTPSVKTRKAMVVVIVPRIVDPSEAPIIIQMFERSADDANLMTTLFGEKAKQITRHEEQALQGHSASKSKRNLFKGVRGRGGRGRGTGRGGQSSRTLKT